MPSCGIACGVCRLPTVKYLMTASAFAALSLGVEPTSPMATTGEDQASPLLDLVERFPDLFAKEVLRRVDPADRAFIGQVNSGCRAAVVASDLPCAGTRVGMRQLNPADRARLAEEVRAYISGGDMLWGVVSASQLGTLASLGYVESSDLPRAGAVVRLELKEFCTSVGRLAWAKASGCRWDERTCKFAAAHLEVLEWARAHGCPWRESHMCVYAAQGGRLEVLKWLREHSCPWDAMTCYFAARGGHLEVLQWARECHCRWNADTLQCRRRWRARGGVAVGSGARLRVERGPRS